MIAPAMASGPMLPSLSQVSGTPGRLAENNEQDHRDGRVDPRHFQPEDNAPAIADAVASLALP